jgi:hypothetical protein
VLLIFHKKILSSFRLIQESIYKCGTILEKENSDGVWCYEVNNFNAIQTNVIPFFNRFGFLSAKKRKEISRNFKKIAKLIENKRSSNDPEGIKQNLENQKRNE